MKIRISVVYGDRQSRICGGAMRSYRKWYRAHAWPEVTSPEVTWLSPPYFFFHTFFSRNFCSYFFFPYFFFSVFFSPVLFSPYFFFPYYFSSTFSKVATFEIQRFKISVICFSSTWRYNTVHVPCGISIQTSSVGLPKDRWGARMRDLKGPKQHLIW